MERMNATSRSDFDLRQVRRQRMSVYIGITPDHLAEAGRLINLMFSQLVNVNTKVLPQDDPTLKYPCLLLMDEFTAIGKVNIISKAVSYMAGYGLRLLPIIQSLSQLISVYGQEEARTFVTNHALQIFYAPREQKDANEVSEILGYETVKGKSISQSKGGKSETQSDQRRALLLPQELKELGQWKQIINLENMKPILCEKIKYFDDPVFKKRLLKPANVPLLDMETYAARLQGRVRPLTLEDLVQGIDVEKIAIDWSSLKVPNPDHMSEEEIEAYANHFVNLLNIAGQPFSEKKEPVCINNQDSISEKEFQAEVFHEKLEAIIDQHLQNQQAPLLELPRIKKRRTKGKTSTNSIHSTGEIL